MADAIFLLQLVATLSLVGLIWFVQVVHYPLMSRVGAAEFCRYEQDHQRRTTLVVAPLMLTEVGTAVLLCWSRPPAMPLAACVAGLAMLAAIWLSTGLWQVPIHRELSRERRPETLRRLVRSNWLRTVLWSARGGLLVWFAASSLAS